MTSRFVLALAALTTLAAADARAQKVAGRAAAPGQQGPQALTLRVQNRTAAAAAANGAARRDTTVHAGDVLRYTLTFTNLTSGPARRVAIGNPIPGQLAFVGGSEGASRPDARAEFSADGGKSWATRPMETVTVDGKQVSRPVPPERYTNVRWTVEGPVQPGATVTAHYDARLVSPVVARAASGR